MSSSSSSIPTTSVSAVQASQLTFVAPISYQKSHAADAFMEILATFPYTPETYTLLKYRDDDWSSIMRMILMRLVFRELQIRYRYLHIVSGFSESLASEHVIVCDVRFPYTVFFGGSADFPYNCFAKTTSALFIDDYEHRGSHLCMSIFRSVYRTEVVRDSCRIFTETKLDVNQMHRFAMIVAYGQSAMVRLLLYAVQDSVSEDMHQILLKKEDFGDSATLITEVLSYENNSLSWVIQGTEMLRRIHSIRLSVASLTCAIFTDRNGVRMHCIFAKGLEDTHGRLINDIWGHAKQHSFEPVFLVYTTGKTERGTVVHIKSNSPALSRIVLEHVDGFVGMDGDVAIGCVQMTEKSIPDRCFQL